MGPAPGPRLPAEGGGSREGAAAGGGLTRALSLPSKRREDGERSIFVRLKEGGYRLKDNVLFHLYVSASPCGDARLNSPHELTADRKRPRLLALGPEPPLGLGPAGRAGQAVLQRGTGLYSPGCDAPASGRREARRAGRALYGRPPPPVAGQGAPVSRTEDRLQQNRQAAWGWRDSGCPRPPSSPTWGESSSAFQPSRWQVIPAEPSTKAV